MSVSGRRSHQGADTCPPKATKWSAVGKVLISAPDLGNQCLGDVVTDAGNSLQSLDGVTKGCECGLQPEVEFRNGGFELLDRL